MDGGKRGAGAAGLFSGGVGGPFWTTVNDEPVLTAEEVTPSTGFFLSGGGFVRNGTMPSPGEAATFAEAALAASFLPVPSGGGIDGGGREESNDPQQAHRHPVYGFPQAFTGWSGDGSRSRVFDDSHNYLRPHKEPWAAIDPGFEDSRDDGRADAVGRHGGSAGTRDHGEPMSAKRHARMDSLEQELLTRTPKRVAGSMMAPSLPTAHGMVFPPPRRDLAHLLQDSRRTDKAMKIISTNPGAAAPPFAINSTAKDPAVAVRRRRGSPSTEEGKPFFPAMHSEEQYRHLDIKGPSGRSARAAAGPPTIPGIGNKNVGGRCQHPGCSRVSTFGPRGGGKQSVYCIAHKEDGMVKITSRQCARDTCSTAPSYGFQGKRASPCSKHKMPGMINVVTPRCLKDGCGSCASYGHMAERRPLFCARHAHAGMSNVVSRKCLGVGCVKNPSYGHPGDRRASFCVDHHLAGMSNIVSPKCLAPGCGKAPSFGASGDRKPTWCKAHTHEGMINILYSRQLKKAV